jgi:hypothetical protein
VRLRTIVQDGKVAVGRRFFQLFRGFCRTGDGGLSQVWGRSFWDAWRAYKEVGEAVKLKAQTPWKIPDFSG